MDTAEALLQRNRQYAATFDQGGKSARPACAVAILTCMDARLHPERFLGLEIGDAHVIRNAGGRASDDALRSLIVSSAVLGTKQVLVIHHTDCGMLRFPADQLRDRLTAQSGQDASGVDFQGFSDLDDSVRDDVRRIRNNPFLPAEITITGYVYDVDAGALTPVPAAAG